MSLSLSNVMVNTCGQGSEKKLVRFSELCPNLHKDLFPGILIHLMNKKTFFVRFLPWEDCLSVMRYGVWGHLVWHLSWDYKRKCFFDVQLNSDVNIFIDEMKVSKLYLLPLTCMIHYSTYPRRSLWSLQQNLRQRGIGLYSWKRCVFRYLFKFIIEL